MVFERSQELKMKNTVRSKAETDNIKKSTLDCTASGRKESVPRFFSVRGHLSWRHWVVGSMHKRLQGAIEMPDALR